MATEIDSRIVERTLGNGDGDAPEKPFGLEKVRAALAECQVFWVRVIGDKSVDLGLRLKASELLAKTIGGNTEARHVTAHVTTGTGWDQVQQQQAH